MVPSSPLLSLGVELRLRGHRKCRQKVLMYLRCLFIRECLLRQEQEVLMTPAPSMRE